MKWVWIILFGVAVLCALLGLIPWYMYVICGLGVSSVAFIGSQLMGTWIAPSAVIPIRGDEDD